MKHMWINNFKFFLAKSCAHITYFVIKTFNIGTGYTWPGHVALKLYPNILSNSHIHFNKGIVVISGTNGKTTTAKIVTTLISQQDNKVVHNTSGANLLNGIVAACLLSPIKSPDYGVFEVDEFVLPKLLKYISPTALILLNLSRDQLDRYGETDIIFDRWLNTFSSLRSNCFLLLNKDQPEFHKISSVFNGRILFFDGSTSYLDKSNFKASFYAFNINAALLAINVLGLDHGLAVSALSSLEVAYGRGEVLNLSNNTVSLFLNKNPRSANINLSSLDPFLYDSVVFVLNDKIPDGRDISWIYDIDSDLLVSFCANKNIYVSGTRGLEMVVRLVYAGIPLQNITYIADLISLVSVLSALSAKNLVCFPNYSAMLEFRKIILGRGIL